MGWEAEPSMPSRGGTTCPGSGWVELMGVLDMGCSFFLGGGKREAFEGFWSSMVFAGNSNPILRRRIARKRWFFPFGWHWSERVEDGGFWGEVKHEEGGGARFEGNGGWG